MVNSLKEMAIQGIMANSPSTGQYIQGQGGGLADAIPAQVVSQGGDVVQPAALSESEFVVPADVVSMLGDGSSEAGARILEQMIAEIRSAKTGTEKQAKPIEEV